MAYKEELIKAMDLLSNQDSSIFVGYNINYGSKIYGTMDNIPKEKKIEFPIAEDMQMGVSIGLSLEGYIPISIYPRIDFLIIATNQLVNHLDKIEEMSCGQFKPKVIIRTAIGSTKPLYPGLQHCSDYTMALKHMLKNVDVIKLNNSKDIIPAYKNALEETNNKSTLLIEVADFYSNQ